MNALEDRLRVSPARLGAFYVAFLHVPKTGTQQGEVLAVGPGKRAENTGELIPLDISVGDTVLYSKYGGTEVTVDGEDLLVLNGRDVLAKVEK